MKQGGVGVGPTDTIYGVLGSALSSVTVERIYDLRKRNPEKPMIVLISKISDLGLFKIELNKWQKEWLKKVWPDKVSVVLKCDKEKYSYLHRGTKSLAFRMPTKEDLRDLLSEVGPLVAPSANPEGLPAAINIEEARKYFGERVDFYVKGEDLVGRASTVASLTNDKMEILRQGEVLLPEIG